jgi:lipopolysaccharide export system ATP-binding protein
LKGSAYVPLPSGYIPVTSSAQWRRVETTVPSAPPQAVLSARNLTKRFGKREVVRGVDLEVGAGEIVGLLGRNGAGKTTTFRMIMGLLHPDGGVVTYENRDISKKPMYERANRGIGYLAQQPSVFQRMTVEENLLAILELQERTHARRMERLEELIANLGLGTVRKSMASVLSGGERRRLEIARAMSLRPKIVLFDEPFAGIDPIAVSEIQGILRELKAKGVGVLLTDHNVRETLTITDRTYIMDEGKIWISGPPREIVANADARARYLGHDFRLDF